MTKLLLSSVCRPFGGLGEGASVGAELFHAQITRAQGPLSPRQVIRVWGLDYIAENIDVPTVTLHYPSRREFVRELRGGGYSHVGINFVVATFHKVRDMVELVRQHSPGTKVILGGYGTVLPDELLRPYADAICREEGIGFMRRLFNEPVDRPIRTPHVPVPVARILGFQRRGVVGHVTAGLGCPNGCDFCCTSHFFKRRHIPYLETGRELYEELIATRERAKADGIPMQSFSVIDEDFFIHHRRAREFLDCVREGGELFTLLGFGSVKGLSHFTAREIAEMGFDLVWNAFEGKKSGYQKQEGRPLDELYGDLTSVGVGLLTSMIIGFPYQDEAIMREEFEELMALEPSMLQCLIYFAFPGTPFHQQVIQLGRYRDSYREAPDLRKWDGFAMHYTHPNFENPEDVEKLQREFYRQDFKRLGSSLARLGRVWLTGYENLRDDPNPVLAARAERLRGEVRALLPVITAETIFGPSQRARERAVALRNDVIRLTGSLTIEERATAACAPLGFLGVRMATALGILQQPGLLRTAHRMEGAEKSQHSTAVLRLQGGWDAGILAGLRDDLEDRLATLWPKSRKKLDRKAITPEARIVTRQQCELDPSVPPAELPRAESDFPGPGEQAEATRLPGLCPHGVTARQNGHPAL